MRRLALNAVYNLRELGGYPVQTNRVTRERVFLRSDNLTLITPQEIHELKAYGLSTVIDLRHSGETNEEPDPLTSDPAIDYRNIAVLDYAEFTLEDMNRIRLSDLYITMAENAGFITQVFEVLAQAEGTVLFHCTAGKDRTGIIAALLLKLVGVADPDIIADYQVSATYLTPKYAHRTESHAALYLNLFDSKPETMVEFLRYIDTRYGSIEAYFSAKGVNPDTLNAIRDKFLEERQRK